MPCKIISLHQIVLMVKRRSCQTEKTFASMLRKELTFWRLATHQCVVEDLNITVYVVPMNKFSSNFEVCASEVLENCKEMFSYYQVSSTP